MQDERKVTVVSAHTTQGASTTFKALALGALDFIAKPQDAASAHMAAQSDFRVRPWQLPLDFAKLPTKPKRREHREPTRVIAVGISTGGPNTLQYVLSQLPGDFPGSLVIVQHVPEGFTEMFARRLDESCAIEVKEAKSGDLLVAGRALICPGNRHMRLRRMTSGNVVVLSEEPRVNGHRPSVEVLFRSLAQEFGRNGIAVLMTGMGDDGAVAMGEVKAAGGLTTAQSEETCVVYGMPRAAAERGFASRVAPLEILAHTLLAQCASPRPAALAAD